MGSHSFENTYYGNLNAQQAYRHLVDEALHEHGHDGYNGTISTTSGVVVAGHTPMTLAEAYKIAEKRIDRLSKWEACEALPLVAETPDQWERTGTHEVTLDLPGESMNDTAKVRALLAKSLKIKVDQIEDVRIAFDRANGHQRKATVEPKVTAKATEGKTETRYFVIAPDQRAMPEWKDGFGSQAEARASLTSGVLKYEWGGAVPAVDVEIISMTRRVSGEALVKATVSVKRAQVTYEVTTRRLVKKGTRGTTQAGWLFYGWAAS